MAAMATDAPAGGAPVVTRLLCVRHGETHWNEQGWLQGHQETSLNELGRRQATAAGKYLATHHRGAVAIISSDLGRTRETAELIGAELGLPVQLTPLLRETHLGAFQGLTWEEGASWAAVGRAFNSQAHAGPSIIAVPPTQHNTRLQQKRSTRPFWTSGARTPISGPPAAGRASRCGWRASRSS